MLFRSSTVAGNGVPGYSGDGHAATAATLNQPFGVAVGATGNIYIADVSNYVIRMVSEIIIPPSATPTFTPTAMPTPAPSVSPTANRQRCKCKPHEQQQRLRQQKC